MTTIQGINLKVVVMDSDFYALQSLNSYLAWDRRTRVMFLADSLEALWRYLREVNDAEKPDMVVIDPDHMGGAGGLLNCIARIRSYAANARIMCLAQQVDMSLVEAATKGGASGYLLKQDVRLQIAWALVYSIERDFVVTQGIASASKDIFNSRLQRAKILPEQREYPEMTERIRQAIKLCVIEGMPAHLAADEMGISLHTIRGYIKEGYRILEAYDHSEYPVDMTPQERAFMRFTALADHVGDEELSEDEL